MPHAPPLHPLRAPGGGQSGTQRVSGSGGVSDRSKDPAFQATPGRGDGVAFQLGAERGLGTKMMGLAWARPREAAFPQGRGPEVLVAGNSLAAMVEGRVCLNIDIDLSLISPMS